MSSICAAPMCDRWRRLFEWLLLHVIEPPNDEHRIQHPTSASNIAQAGFNSKMHHRNRPSVTPTTAETRTIDSLTLLVIDHLHIS